MAYLIAAVSIVISLMTGATGSGRQSPVNGQALSPNEAATRCPLIYAPVVCDNGKTYPNQCEADRHHAQNCVPAGEF